ncbi:hypothetical protein GCM10009609_30660 [Pseudonocardia aurantiaca]|uniref:PucR family transcriptional regulator n=1 Tax=Pseudonocardia aurantiaca TaxID=75290 RepID=A0ABW4FTQ1_9PSEU
MNDAIEVVVQLGIGYALVLLIGVLSIQTMAALRTRLTDVLHQAGCVVADVSRLELRHPGCVSVFGAAVEQAGGWPAARLALTGASPRMVTHLSSRHVRATVPVADSVLAALAMTDQPPRQARTEPEHDEGSPRITALAQTDPEGARFVQEWLGLLIEHDAFGRSQLVTTLSTFLECDCDHEGTARALGIHRSTVRYRIQRVGEITQLDLHNAEMRYFLRAATRILDRSAALVDAGTSNPERTSTDQ